MQRLLNVTAILLAGCATPANDTPQGPGVASLLFGKHEVAARHSMTQRSYPVELQRAWRDVLTVVGQTGFISQCDPGAGIVGAVLSPQQTVAVLVVSEGFSRTTVSVKLKGDSVSSSDTKDAEQALLDKISTQLLARHRLQHLLTNPTQSRATSDEVGLTAGSEKPQGL